ncbi:MAG: hypothetical protein PHI63_03850 [Patescibacteria group bacterium]|nr:hypothetical protein [Patescibacteria group bacterium]
MARRRQSSVAPRDWIKIFIILAVGITAAWRVYAVYTEPFYLLDEIQRQRQYQEHETTSPFRHQIPAGGGGQMIEIVPAPTPE